MLQLLQIRNSAENSPNFQNLESLNSGDDGSGAIAGSRVYTRGRYGTRSISIKLSILLLFLAGLFHAPEARAGDVNTGNVIGSNVLQAVYNSDGYMFYMNILCLDNSGLDGDFLTYGKLYFNSVTDNNLIFEVNDYGNTDDEGEWLRMNFMPKNGFTIFVQAMNGGYNSGYIKSGVTNNVVRGNTNSDGDVWMRVYIYVPQNIVEKGTVSLFFRMWDQDGNEGGGVNCDFHTGNILTFPASAIPSISGTPTAAVNPAKKYYSLSYNLSGSLNKAATTTLRSTMYSSNYLAEGTLAAGTTNGSFTNENTILNSEEVNHSADLEIKWTHSNTGLVYTASKTNIPINHINYPTSITAVNNNDGTVTLYWTTDTDAEQNSVNHNWRLQYGRSGEGWKDISASITKGDRGYTFTIPTEEREQGVKSYEFRVNRACFNAGVLSAKVVLAGVNTNYQRFTAGSMMLKNDGKIYFKTDNGMKPSNLSYNISGYRVSDNSAINATGIEEVPNGTAEYTEGYRWRFTPTPLPTCVPLKFNIQTNVGGTVKGTVVTQSGIMYSPDFNSKIVAGTYKASKGYYNDRVSLKWDIDANAADFDRFVVYRYLLSDPTNTAVKVYDATYNKTTGNYAIAFNDDGSFAGSFAPSPGSFYRYELKGITTCDTQTDTINLGTEIGFAQAFGQVSGQVNFENTTTGVPNVDIIFENTNTTEDIGRNRALDFGNQRQTGYMQFPTPWVAGSAAQTIQMWLKLDAEKPAGQGHQIFYGCVPQYKNDTTWIITDTVYQQIDLLNCDFEDAADRDAWTFNNGSYTNKWVISNQAGTSGNITGYKLYVSNDIGVNNAYTITSTSTVTASRPIVSTGAESYTLEFDFRCGGESRLDFVKVLLVDANVTTYNYAYDNGDNVVTTNTLWSNYPYILNGYNGSNYNYKDSVQHITATLTAAKMGAAGTQKKLVFLWRNDSSVGYMPPAAIDNIKISYQVIDHINRVIDHITPTTTELDPLPQLDIWLDENRQLGFELFGNEAGNVTLDTVVFPLGVYFHYTGVVTKSGSNYTLTNYLNGNPIGALTLPDVSQALNFTRGRISDNDTIWKIDGKADELRLWNRALTAQEIANDYNRYISATNSTGLRGYYRFDEPDGAVQAVFDLSRNTQTQQYNENHGLLVGEAISRTDLDAPAPELLALKARTNAQGSYNSGMILPYGGNTTYSVRPNLGVHQFTPAQRDVTISDGNTTFSGQDFTDNSKFTYKGKVCYTGGNFPVEGCTFSINSGQGYVTQTDSEGDPIKSNTDGTFTLTVPVGTHTIRVEKPGHTFVQNSITKNFQDDELSDAVVRFWDNTRVRIIGRVVGGTVEGKKPLGFGESNNNVGTAQLEFEAKKAQYHYFVNYNVSPAQPVPSTTETFTHWNGTSANTVRYDQSGSVAKFIVSTNAATGEFYADILPEEYTVKSIKLGAGASTIDYLDGTGIPVDYRDKTTTEFEGMSSQQYLIREIKNTAGVVTQRDSIAYNDTLSYIHRENPSMLITQDGALLNGKPFFGEKILVDKNQYSTQVDTVPLVSVANGQIDYLFGYPQFNTGKTYPMTVNLRESYVNWETAAVDNVPVIGENIVIRNRMGKNGNAQNLYTDSVGDVHYRADVSSPDITTGLRDIQFDYAGSGLASLSQKIDAIVLGSVQSGSNFMTKGPDRVFFVLRDPAGSNSYAYREAGSSNTVREGWSISEELTAGVSLEVHNGVTTTTVSGVGGPALVATEWEFEVENELDAGLFLKQEYTEDKEIDVTYTTTQRVETSAEPDWVGADADVYVGKSTNIIYGNANMLVTAEVGEGDSRLDTELFTSSPVTVNGVSKTFKIGKTTGIALGKSFGTTFFYTQRTIEQQLIPEWYNLRADLLEYVTAQQAQTAANNTGKPVYRSLVAGEDDENYGVTGEGYEIVYPANWNGKNFVDTVAMCNTQIATWETYLALNEKAKVEAKANTDKFNYSIGSGVSLEYSTKKDSVNSMTKMTGAGFNESLEFKHGFLANDLGFVIAGKEEMDFMASDREGDAFTAEETYGFVLSDQDPDNKLTIDIVGAQPGSLEGVSQGSIMGSGADSQSNGVPGGFIFITQGGQTSCPYEGADSTNYYMPGTPLNIATEANERPSITPAAGTTTTRTGVPANAQAFYTVRLSNQESQVGAWYDLRVASGTNPLGATVKMDGAVLTENGQPIYIPAGEAVTKTISIERGNGYNFDNIKLVLASQCQYNYLDDVEDIFSAIELTAHFQTGCSDIRLAQPLNQWTLNTNDTIGVITVRVDNFDANLPSLGWVDLQYKASYSSSWNTLKRYYMSSAVMNGDGTMSADLKELYNGAGYIAYNWNLGSPALFDGNYDIRAVASCVNMQNYTVEYQTPSSVSTGIKDTQRPEIFGRPQPRDGVLDVEDEIMIQFNEAIAAQMLVKGSANGMGNLYVQGIKNEGQGPLYHPAAVHFDGAATATTANDVTLQTPFTIEAWIRPALNYQTGEHVIFSHGDNLKVGIAGERIFVENNGTTVLSPEITFYDVTPEWGHLAIAVGTDGIAYGYYAKGNTTTTFNGNVGAYNRTGRVAIGNAVAGGAGVNADIHDLRVWNTKRSESEISQNLTKSYLGIEAALKHYWRMDEAQGNTATELKGGLTATLGGATWALTNTGRALSLTQGSNLKVPGAELSFTSSQDYAIEMWFKGAAQNNATLFSAGNGNGQDRLRDHAANSTLKLSIGFNSNGKLAVVSNGKTLTAAANYLDNAWHHLVFTVNRLSNASLYVDGNQVNYTAASDIGGLQSEDGYYTLGQRVWHNNTLSPVSDNPFTGKIDNFRIWNAALDALFIKDNKNVRLNEKQPALVANYPFESYSLSASGSPEVKDSLINFVEDRIETYTVGSGTGYIPMDTAKLTGGASLVSNDYAPVKMEGPNQDLGFHYVTSGDKIIITMTEPRNRIEGTLLTFIADRVQDLNGNIQKSAVVWTALVNQTQLRWSQKELVMETQPAVVNTQTVTISNTGGTSQAWNITGIPSWLQVTPSSGTIAAQATQSITIKSVQSTAVGNYEQTLLLNGESIDQMTVKLKVRSNGPDWSVNPNAYQNSTSVIGALRIDGAYSTDVDDKLAVFVNGECRGVANVTYEPAYGRYIVYLTVYSNDFSADNFTYRIWDASASAERQAVTLSELNFASGENSFGSVTSPIVFEATNVAVGNILLAQGWTWISLNKQQGDMSVNTVFSSVAGLASNLKSQNNGFTVPTSTGDWYTCDTTGVLNTVDNVSGYKIRMNASSVLETVGTLVNPNNTPLTVKSGWNWLGYTAQGVQSVTQGFSGLQPINGDLVKDQTSFATYNNGTWTGTLTTLQPGKAYIYQSKATAAKTFTYPQVAAQQGAPRYNLRALAHSAAESAFNPVPPTTYSNNMNVIAVVKDGAQTLTNVELGAFVGSECRGAQTAGADGIIFLTIAGEESGALLDLKVAKSNGEIVTAPYTLPYTNDGLTGTLNDPYVIQLDPKYGGLESIAVEQIAIYPNPVKSELFITSALPIKRVEITSVTGTVLQIEDNFNEKLSVASLPAGVYMVKIHTDNGVAIRKVVKE